MNFNYIKNAFSFLEEDFDYELVELIRHDNKFEFEFLYSNKSAKRSITIVFNGSGIPDIVISKFSKQNSIFQSIAIKIGFNEFSIADYAEVITDGRINKSDLVKQYKPELYILYIKDHQEQSRLIIELYQKILKKELGKVIIGEVWINWKELQN